MHTTTNFIVILCTFILYVVLCVGGLSSSKANYERLEKSAKRALRMTFYGLLALGLAFLMLSQFKIVSFIGYEMLPAQTISKIRDVMRVVLNTGSVYKAIEIFIAIILLSVEFCLIFSCVGLLVTKALPLLQKLLCTRLGETANADADVEVAMPRKTRRIFLQFANLRI